MFFSAVQNISPLCQNFKEVPRPPSYFLCIYHQSLGRRPGPREEVFGHHGLLLGAGTDYDIHLCPPCYLIRLFFLSLPLYPKSPWSLPWTSQTGVWPVSSKSHTLPLLSFPRIVPQSTMRPSPSRLPRCFPPHGAHLARSSGTQLHLFILPFPISHAQRLTLSLFLKHQPFLAVQFIKYSLALSLN